MRCSQKSIVEIKHYERQIPRCRYDTILVLNGPQDIGKSIFIDKLGGEWFSDSLQLVDIDDKTAAEKLQGYWVLEIG